MSVLSLPRLRLMPHSQLGDDSWHSLLISLARGLAALQVAAAHLRAECMPGLRSLDNPALWYQGLAFFTGFAHQAVVLFFLISGWLVGGSLLNKRSQPDAFRHYAIDRITRLWTVLLPTLLLMLALGMLTGTVDPRTADFAPANPYSATAFAGNLLGLQTVVLPEFGNNFPLWSLANETWYYLMFPLLLCLTGRHRLPAAAALMLCALMLPFNMTLYFLVWLLGAAFSRVRLDCGAATRALLLLSLLGLAIHVRLWGSNDDLGLDSFGQDVVLSLVFLLFLCSTVVKPNAPARIAPLRRLADFFSAFSFTLYVTHIPAIRLLRWLGATLVGRDRLGAGSMTDLALYLTMLVIVLVFAYGFYRLFEARTFQVRRWLKRVAGNPQPGLRAM